MQRWSIKEVAKAKEVYEDYGMEAAAMAVKRSVKAVAALRARGWMVSTSERKVSPTVRSMALDLAVDGGVTATDLQSVSMASIAYCRKVLCELVEMGVMTQKGRHNNVIYFLK